MSTNSYEFCTMSGRNADVLWTAIGAAQRHIPIYRRLTHHERLLLALLSVLPSHMLTLSSAEMSRPEAMTAWAKFRKRMARHRKPLVYLATVVKAAETEGGYHVHALLYEYIHASVVHGHARAVGFRPDIGYLPDRPELQHVIAIAYVLGQTEPVFGTDHHDEHLPRGPGEQRLHHPQGKLLAKAAPDLLSALNDAKDPAVTDEMLIQRVPRFIER